MSFPLSGLSCLFSATSPTSVHSSEIAGSGRSHSRFSLAVSGLSKGLISSFKYLGKPLKLLINFCPSESKKSRVKMTDSDIVVEQTKIRAEVSFQRGIGGVRGKYMPYLGTIEEGSEVSDSESIETPDVTQENEIRNVPEAQSQEIQEEDDEEIDLTAMVNQMNTRSMDDVQWELKSRIVRPAVELMASSARGSIVSSSSSSTFNSGKGILKTAGGDEDGTKVNLKSQKKVKWADSIDSGIPLSRVVQVEKKTPFSLYTPTQKALYHVLSELACRVEPEKGTYGYGFTILGKTELDKENVWDPDQFMAQNPRSVKEQKTMESDVKRLALPERHVKRMSSAAFLKKHVRK